MQTTVETAALVKALPILRTIVAKRNAIPILGHVLINPFPDRITVTATDLDNQITLTVPANGDSFTLCPSLADLESFAKLAPKGSLTHISDSGSLQAGPISKPAECLPVDDFPTMAESAPQWQGTIPAPVLAEVLRVTTPSISDEQTRYYLRGVYLHEVNGQAAFCSTDGHRLALHKTAIPYTGPGVIVHKDTLKPLAKLLAKRSGDITVTTSPRHITIGAEGFTIAAKVIDGTFPDYTRVFPKDTAKYTATVALDMIPKVRDLTFVFGKEAATCDSITIHGPTLTGDVEAVGFDPRHMRDFAALSSDGKITLAGVSAGDPAKVTVTGAESTAFLLMPRLR